MDPMFFDAVPHEAAIGAVMPETVVTPSEPDLEIEGYASLFYVRDLNGDVVLPGAFHASLKRTGAAGVRMLYQHEADAAVGQWDAIYEDDRGLYVRGRLFGTSEPGRKAIQAVRDLGVDGLSIGFRTLKARTRADGVRELSEIELWEVSVVAFPMLAQARLAFDEAETQALSA